MSIRKTLESTQKKSFVFFFKFILNIERDRATD